MSRLATVAALLALLAACREFPAERPCEADEDCRAGRICRATQCVVAGADAASPPATCGLAYPDADRCGTCLAAECCDAAEACGADESCRAYHGCLATCAGSGDPDCAGACTATFRSHGATPQIAALGACLSARCVEDCGHCGTVSQLETAACEACIAESRPVCELQRTCGRDPACHAALLCPETCSNPRCAIDCIPRTPEIQRPWQDAVQGVAGICGPQCGIGRDWSCVEAYDWGVRTADTIQVRVRLERLRRPEPIVGAHVRACTHVDPDCLTPLGEATSGQDSAVVITMPIPQQGFDGFFWIDAAGFQPTLLGPGRPLVSDTGLASSLLTPAEVEIAAQVAGQPAPDPDKAQIVVIAFDCAAKEAPGLQLSVRGPEATHEGVYLSQGAPDPDATGTDLSGVAIFGNVGLGGAVSNGARVRARLAADGRDVAAGVVPLRRGFMTTAYLYPAPSR